MMIEFGLHLGHDLEDSGHNLGLDFRTHNMVDSGLDLKAWLSTCFNEVRV